MSASSYSDVALHLGHNLEVAIYGNGIDNPTNAAIECIDCYEVLMDFDKEE
jgi:hypothetical protein